MAGARNRADSKVKAVVSFYGPHDLERRAVEQKEITESIRDFLGVAELNPKSIKVLHDASPINHIAAGMPPYLLIHGRKDEKVPYDQSPKMCQAMRAAGGACDLFTVEEGQHGMGGWEKAPAQQKYKIRMIEWLKETLN